MLEMEDGDKILIEREDYSEVINHLVDDHLFKWDIGEIGDPTPFLYKAKGDEMCKLSFTQAGDQIQMAFHENIPV